MAALYLPFDGSSIPVASELLGPGLLMGVYASDGLEKASGWLPLLDRANEVVTALVGSSASLGVRPSVEPDSVSGRIFCLTLS